MQRVIDSILGPKEIRTPWRETCGNKIKIISQFLYLSDLAKMSIPLPCLELDLSENKFCRMLYMAVNQPVRENFVFLLSNGLEENVVILFL